MGGPLSGMPKLFGRMSGEDTDVACPNNHRILPGGECVSVDGTHLGHNIPDSNGHRYCINLVSIAGRESKS